MKLVLYTCTRTFLLCDRALVHGIIPGTLSCTACIHVVATPEELQVDAYSHIVIYIVAIL